MKVNCEKLKMYIPNPRSRTKKRNKIKLIIWQRRGKKPILKQSKAKKQTTKTKQNAKLSIQKSRKERRKGNEQIGDK